MTTNQKMPLVSQLRASHKHTKPCIRCAAANTIEKWQKRAAAAAVARNEAEDEATEIHSIIAKVRDWAERGDGYGSHKNRTTAENNGYAQAVDEVAALLKERT